MNKPASIAFFITLLTGLFLVMGLWVFQLPFHLFFLGVIVFAYIVSYTTLQKSVFQRLKRILERISPNRTNDFQNVIVDLENSVKAIERLQKKEIKVLKDRERYRREFIGNVSHELKTPIFNVQGYLLTLLDGATDDPEITEKYLKRANKSIERIISIIKDLDFITKLEAGALDIHIKAIDVHALVLDVVEQMEDLAKERGVDIRVKTNIDPPLMVMADIKRIEQILVNLINNAIKYSKSPDSYVEIGFNERSNSIEVYVSDNGLGIPKDDLPRIFERFYRVDKSRTRDAGGSGLGLAIVKHIIEAHKQNIRVESTEGVGSSFIFSLKKTNT